MLESLDSTERIQTREEEDRRAGLGTAEQPTPAQTTFGDPGEQVRAEDRLRLALDTIPALLHSAEADGSLDYFNQRWLDYLGVSLGDIKGWGWISKIHPDDLDAFVKEWRSSLRTGEPLEAEARVRRQDGVYRWMLHRKVPLRDEQGKVVKWYGSSIDIHDRKQAEDALRLGQTCMAHAQRLAQIGSWAYRFSDEVHWDNPEHWSEELWRITDFDPSKGFPATELIFSRIHPEDRKRVVEATTQTIKSGQALNVKYRYFRADGTLRVFCSVGAVIHTDDMVKRYVGATIDVTEQERVLDELKRSEFYLAEGQRLGHAGSWSFKPDFTCDYWSRELYEILGFDPEGGVPTISDYFTRVHPEDREVVEATIRRMIAAGEGCDLKKRIIRPDGVQRVIRCVGMPVWQSGVVTRFVGTLMDITEQEELTQELRRREAYLAEAQKVSHTGSWAWSPVSNAILYWSEECYRISGYDPAQGLPSFESSFQRIHPEDQPVLAETIERAVREKAEFQIEYRQVLPDGTRSNIRILSHPVLDASGKLVEFIGTVMDVTEQRRAEEGRRAHLWFLESMDRINRAMQRTNDVEGMMSGVLEETLAIFGSDRAWLVYPCDPDADTSRVVMEHTRPEYPGAFALGKEFPMDTQTAGLLRSVLDGPGAATDLSVPAEIRERFSIQSMIAIAVRPKGDRPYLFGLHQCSHARAWTAAERRLFEEIARRLEDALTSVLAHRNMLAREEELRQSEAYLAEAQKLSQTGSWAWSPDQDIRYWSEECYRVLSFDPQDGLPRFEEFFQRIHPDDQPGFRELIQTAIREKAQWVADYRIVHPDGPVRDIHVVGRPVLSTSGHLVEFVGTVIDVTERKRADAALQEARAELERVTRVTTMGELAASIAHEINQPLAGVVTSASAGLNWLANQPPNLLKTREAIERILRDGTRAGEVLTRIRALIKRTAPAKSPVSVNQVIRDVVVLTEGELRQKNVELSLELDSTLPEIQGDEIQLQQVFLNLIKNAIEAMDNIGDRRKVLLIRSGLGQLENRPAISVQISDTGVGFDSANTDGLFQAFYTTKPEGMGMGLWISRSIIDAHRAQLTAFSNNGSGATFQILLPVEEDAAGGSARV